MTIRLGKQINKYKRFLQVQKEISLNDETQKRRKKLIICHNFIIFYRNLILLFDLLFSN